MQGHTAVIVCTLQGGVIFGWTQDYSGSSVRLKGARMCISWPRRCRGLFGLASAGPGGSLISPPVTECIAHNVHHVMLCGRVATDAWDMAR